MAKLSLKKAIAGIEDELVMLCLAETHPDPAIRAAMAEYFDASMDGDPREEELKAVVLRMMAAA